MKTWVHVFTVVFGAVAVYLFAFMFEPGEDIAARALIMFVIFALGMASGFLDLSKRKEREKR